MPNKRSALCLLLATLCLTLSGCGTIRGGNNEVALRALGNLEHCRRTYIASIGMGGAASVNIECPPKPYEAQAIPNAPSAQ